ncbi:MAG: hypothetical protein R2867_16075 [Caldilineaceae bacterium]
MTDNERKDRTVDPLAAPSAALQQRGNHCALPRRIARGTEIERIQDRCGRLLERSPKCADHPIFMHGLGKALPRGDFLLAFLCRCGHRGANFSGAARSVIRCRPMRGAMQALAAEVERPVWE